MKELGYVYATSAWFMGMALAGGWWKLLAIAFPPYSFYVLADWVVKSQM